MKNFSFLLTLFVSISLGFGQGFEISEAARAMNSGTFNSFLFELPDVSKKEAEENWKNFMNDFKAKTKYDRKAGLWFSDNAKLPRLSNNTVDVYARIIEDANPNKRTTVIVWFDLGGAYVTTETHRESTASAQDILTEFAMNTSRHHALAIVKAEEKQLKDFENGLKKLEKDNATYKKEIEKAKELIAKRNKDIEINEQDQDMIQGEINKQKQIVRIAKEEAKKFN